MTMRSEHRLELQKDLARHLRAGHPWVFRKALARAPRGLPAGTIVDVVEGDRFVARGYYDPTSAITVRVLTREEGEEVDAAFWRRRVARALALRKELVRGTTAYRLLHGESDGLPGVVADRYDRFAVIKLYSAGLTPWRDDIVEARLVCNQLRANAGSGVICDLDLSPCCSFFDRVLAVSRCGRSQRGKSEFGVASFDHPIDAVDSLHVLQD